MRPRLALVVPLFVATPSFAASQQAGASRPPIIDVHLHAMPVAYFGKPPGLACAARLVFPGRDPRDSSFMTRAAECAAPLRSPETDEALMTRTLELLRRHNIVGVTSGPASYVRRWKAAAPDRIIWSAAELPDTIRELAKDGHIRAIGELGFQYAGLSPSDSASEAYLALAETLDLPVGVHMGLGPPGAAYGFSAKYRARHGSPLLLEDVLVRHPNLRLYVMHAGWPMLDEMIALLYAHPQVYVDVAVINWAIPRAEFHHYLKRLVDAGFGKRIMFGSDQMIWPDAIPIAIDAIESAPFLTPAQKRDIFYHNAVRFFRLDASRPVQ